MVILTLVFMAARQNHDLVTETYYEESLEWDDTKKKLENTMRLSSTPLFKVNREANLLEVEFPVEFSQGKVSGELHLYRPSDARWDRSFELALDSERVHRIPINTLPPGNWTVKMDWKHVGREFMLEEKLSL